MKILYAGPANSLHLTNTGQGRKEGVHLSDILKRMAFERDKKYNPNNPIDAMTLEVGHTWETVLERALSVRHQRPGYRPEQLQEDGVWMSPDWVNPDADIQVEEWKATRKSSKAWEQKVNEWLPQVKSYLRALLKQGVVKRLAVRIRAWFVVGDWSFEAKSDHTLLRDYWDIDLEFDKRELEENWRQIISAGKRYGLLKGKPEETCQKQKPEAKKSDSSPRVRSSAKVLTGTFPRTKTLSKPRNVS